MAKILLEVNNSVLWILTESNEAKDNFLLQIKNRGIAKSRVIFANRLNNELLIIYEQDSKWNDEAAKKKLLEYFDMLGLTDPNVISARKQLSTLMFK